MSTSTTPAALPLLLSSSTRYPIPEDLDFINADELKKIGRGWLDQSQLKLPKAQLMSALHKALKDENKAKQAVQAFSQAERQVAAVYQRYGGSVSGEVIRLELMSRGFLEIAEKKVNDHHTSRSWKSNPIEGMAKRWVLLSPSSGNRYDSYYSSMYRSDLRILDYSLNPMIGKQIQPAGPAKWPVPPAIGLPDAITRRSPAEVALNLSRVLAFLSMKGAIKTKSGGVPSATTYRTLEKGVPLEADSEFPLPEPQGLYLNLLMRAGVIVAGAGQLSVDPALVKTLFGQSDAFQAHSWARSWLKAENWFDGFGASTSSDSSETIRAVFNLREALAWALGCLARAGDHWHGLEDFLAAIENLLGSQQSSLPWRDLAWQPAPRKIDSNPTNEHHKISANPAKRSRTESWLANALMVTLVELGLVERGRLNSGKPAKIVFRLTDIGRSVFGAPEIAPTVVKEERKFLLIQPNFDVVAYLEQADSPSASYLGRLAEGASAGSGPVRTFRLTQQSVYQAEEGGLSETEIVAFLRRHSLREPPLNVLKSIADWSGKRESLTLHHDVTLVAFTTEEDRDTFLKRRPGTPCGTRFVITTETVTDKLLGGQPSHVNHPQGGRRTLTINDHALITTHGPLDILQKARLMRIAEPTSIGWRITGESMRLAVLMGLKPTWIHRYLDEHLISPAPALITHAIDAWMGKGPSLELSDAILLFVANEKLFEAMVRSDRLRPFLLGSPGTHWLAVEKGSRKKLTAVLKELGYQVVESSTPSGLSVSKSDSVGDGKKPPKKSH